MCVVFSISPALACGISDLRGWMARNRLQVAAVPDWRMVFCFGGTQRCET
jgi:hypothetical protein